MGDTPTLLILESMWLGSTRFKQLKERTGLQKALLSNRLQRLIKNGVLRKGTAEGGSKHLAYRLTEKGVDLFPTVLTLYVWERKWGSADSRLNLQLRHDACGAPLHPVPVCQSCGEIFNLQHVSFVEGPGLGLMPASYSRRRNQVTFQSDQPSLLRGSVEILGDRWSALIMRAIFTALRRFDEIQDDTGASPAIISDRLKKLVATGVLKTKPYQQHPVRNEYFLTAKGLEYYAVIMMLMLWGDKYYGATEGPPVILTHKSCGAHLVPKIACKNCDAPVTPQNVSIISAGG
ncbi:MAG: helix-turn-helix domain-containing protein [Parasphingorhabdus sp.]|uniref:winged helix-turn-helix transcriptional regulator n=1 Tax=Parasphingorhabdus sp. TaxID=2709688 RepID=UPI00329A7097